MKIRILLTTIVVLAANFYTPSKAQAVITWDWQFTNNNPVVFPGEDVVLLGRLFNQSTAGETIGGLGTNPTAYVGFSDADNITGYSFSFGPSGDLFPQFNTALLPGEFQDFIFGTYLPIGLAPEGTYAAQPQLIGLRLTSDNSDLGQISRCYSWNVGGAGPDGCNPDGGNGGVVPEPASMVLFGSGLVGAFLQKRKKT